MTNLPFTLLLLLWLVVSSFSVMLLVVMARLPKWKEFKDLEGKCAELEQRQNLLEPQVRESAQIAAKLEQDRASAEILRTQIEKLELEKQHLEPLRQKVAEIESMLSQKHNDLNAAVAEERALREEVTRLEGVKKAEVEGIENRRRDLEKLDSETGKLREEYAQLETDIPVAEKNLADLTRRFESTKEDLNRSDSKLQDLHKNYDATKTSLDAMTEKHSQLKGESQALEKEIAERIKHLEALKADHRNLVGADGSEDKMADLWTPCFGENQTLVASGVKEKDRMQLLEKKLAERKLIFSPRTLNAFHTALKVADISPLTVLSGISGTGKSLLPRIYSEAMGIHFLGLAVQPRWDSPQDMFGFYNYMEQKYKATELARAMVQFEVYNKLEKGKNLNDQMLMVLLDEMNLARVEYYFSEFLSKLEVRRDIDPSNNESRRKVEIALEMGHGNGEKEVRLYPARNILFVGTMNEDESTQNLSDKVLDRSCVLRFGRPTNLATNQSADVSSLSEPSKMLRRKTWMEWVDIGAQKSSTKATDTIGELNEVMEMVGKPFAHRVAQAISSYTLNYPDWVRDRENLSLADQVEQRILPKLRGLNVDEHHDAFNKLSSILKGLGDDVLSKAFEAGRDSRNSRGMNSFIWRGVDRSEQQ
jgi:predicted  nucleic acid-binding Zn-ribbon protein